MLRQLIFMRLSVTLDRSWVNIFGENMSFTLLKEEGCTCVVSHLHQCLAQGLLMWGPRAGP